MTTQFNDLKTEEIQITVARWDKNAKKYKNTKATIEAHRFNEFLAIHLATINKKEYALTHIPTGLNIATTDQPVSYVRGGKIEGLMRLAIALTESTDIDLSLKSAVKLRELMELQKLIKHYSFQGLIEDNPIA